MLAVDIYFMLVNIHIILYVLACVFVNLTNSRVILEESFIEKFPLQVGLLASLWCVLLIEDLCMKTQFIVGDANHGQLVLGCIRNQAEQDMEALQ